MLSIIKRLLRLAGKDAYRIRFGFLFSFLGSIFQSMPLISVFYILREIDRGQGEGGNIQFSVIWLCLMVLVIGVLGSMVFRYLLSRFQSGTGYDIFAKQRLVIGDLLKRVPMAILAKKISVKLHLQLLQI